MKYVKVGWVLGTNRIRAALVVALFCTAAACSSAVRDDVKSSTAVTDPAAIGATSSTTPAEGATAAASGKAVGASPKRAPGDKAGGAAAAATGTVTVGGKTLKVSHGVHNGMIDIGIPWLDAAAAGVAVKAITGYSNASIADSHAQAQAVVSYINTHGGIDGLKVNPVYYQLKVPNEESASGRAQEAQSACTAWTQDAHVFAFLVIIGPDPNYLECAAKNQTPIITSGFPEGVDAVQYAQIPNLIYAPGSLVFDDRERMLVDQMAKAGVLSSKSKVGIMIDGSTPMVKRAVDKTLLPELKRRGIPVVSQVAFPDCVESAYDTYALQMRQAGVTHVYFSGTYCGSVPLLLFGRAAENQKWSPEYVVSSDQGPAGNGNTQVSNKGAHMHGVGWLPGADDGSSSGTPAAKTCQSIMQAAGQGDSATTDIFGTGASYCEALFFLQTALTGTGELTPAGLSSGAAALADRWAPVVSRGADFRADHHFGVNTIQAFAFDQACGCMKYTGQPFRFR